jgi:hypothetical protein
MVENIMLSLGRSTEWPFLLVQTAKEIILTHENP